MGVPGGLWGGAKNGGKQHKITSILAWAATATTYSSNMDKIASGRQTPGTVALGNRKRSVRSTMCSETAVRHRAPV